MREASDEWVQFTKRTDDPKLAWIERLLSLVGIESRRHGSSFHAPILQVKRKDEALAWALLDPIDDIPDDHEMFEYADGIGDRYSGKLTILLTYRDDEMDYYVVITDGEYIATTFVKNPPAIEVAVDGPEAYDRAAHAALSFVNDDDQEWVQDFADTDPGFDVEGCYRDHWFIASSKEALQRAYEAMSG